MTDLSKQPRDHKRFSVWHNLWGVLFKPRTAFDRIIASGDFIKAAIILAGINVFFAALAAPKVAAFSKWSLENRPLPPGVSPEQLAAMKTMIPKISAATSIGAALLGPLAIWLLMATILRVYNNFHGGRVSFQILFAVAVFAFAPHIIGFSLKSLLVAFAQPENVQRVTVSLAALLPVSEIGPKFVFFSKLNPFTIWSLALTAYGGSRAIGSTFGKTAVFIFALWAVFVLLETLSATRVSV
ncbi:MAG: YIP1 family protein [Peptococcaceae bacterium]|nr:YIP1 family protein [Peptococcaceae bacterium]